VWESRSSEKFHACALLLLAEGGFLRIMAGEHMEKLLDIPVTPAQAALSLERLGGPTLQTMLSSQSHSLLEMDPVFCSNACEVAHRDVKPANVCLARMQSLKLLDFGSAALLMSKPVHAWP